MPVPPPAAPTKPYSLLINSVDVMTPSGGKGGVPLESIRWTDNGHNAISTMEFTHEDPGKAFAIPAGAEVKFLDQDHGGVLFGGYIMSRELVSLPSNRGRGVRCQVQDYSVLLDRSMVGPAWSSGTVTADYYIVPSVLSAISLPLTVYMQNSTTIGTQTFEAIPARSIVEQCLSLAQGVNQVPMGYWVNTMKTLIYTKLSDFSYTPPGNISDVTPTPGGSMPCENLTLEYDESEIVNAVYVRGASKTATGWAGDTASAATYGTRAATIDQPRALTYDQAVQFGRGYIIDHKDATLRGHFDVDGAYCNTAAKHWHSEQSFTITNTALSLAGATFRTYSVDTQWTGGNGAHTHRVSFGGLPRNGLARILRGITAAGFTPQGTSTLPTAGQRIVGTIG